MRINPSLRTEVESAVRTGFTRTGSPQSSPMADVAARDVLTSLAVAGTPVPAMECDGHGGEVTA